MARQNRPLSPHLQIYRPQITSILSITHRMTGLTLTLGALLLTYWLSAGAYGPEAFARAQGFLQSGFGRIVLFGFTFALFYHLCNGIRHLGWDVGLGFDLWKLRVSGLAVVGAAICLTILSWLFAYGHLGKL